MMSKVHLLIVMMNIKKRDISEVTFFFYVLIRIHGHLTFEFSHPFILNCSTRGCFIGCWFRRSSCIDPILSGYDIFHSEAVKEAVKEVKMPLHK